MNENQSELEKPPIFKSWNRVYVFVIVVHAIVIFLFLLFKLRFNMPA